MSSDERKRWLLFLAIKAGCAAIVFAATLYTLWIVGPRAETRFFPVASKLELTSVVWNDRGQSAIVTARFIKLRPCEFIGLAWYYQGEDKTSVRVPIIRLSNYGGPPPSRPTGPQSVGPWLLLMPAAHVREQSFALIYHECHPFWTTVTAIYP